MELQLAQQPVVIWVGQTLRVSYSFRYRVAGTTNVEVRAYLFHRILGFIDRIPEASGLAVITLERSLEWRDFTGSIDILVGRIGQGVYGLILEVAGVETYIDDCIKVEAVGAWDVVAGLIALALMAEMVTAMVPVMEEAYGVGGS